MILNLYEQSGSDNHGCEAIIRSTIDLFKEDFERIELFSELPETEYKYGLNEICNIHLQGRKIKTRSFEHIVGKVINTLVPVYSPFYNAVHCNYLKSSGISLQTGGDNYCYGNQYRMLGYMNDETRRRKMKSVLWGVSIEPEIIRIPSVTKNLKRYDLIVTREAITYSALIENGIHENVILAPDPAFLLQTIKPENNSHIGSIGVNLSPLILKGEEKKKLILENYINVIRYIIEKTDKTVLLIPHVVVNRNDDREPLKALYEIFKDSGRISMLDDMGAEFIKGYISECSMFIGARTHSTIAAYSSCVPTLVLSYSTKSIGIARDIFNDEKKYVVSTTELKTETQLLDSFLSIYQNLDQEKEYLQKVIPDYTRGLTQARDRVLELKND